MVKLHTQLLAHPIRKKPYNAICFLRFDGNGTPLYCVSNGTTAMGASEALKQAFEQFGGQCFHCKKHMKPQPLSHLCTRDHLRPKKDGGGSFLHNLVFACGPCNRKKGGNDLISFNTEASVEYLKALDDHLVRCIKSMSAK